MNMNSAFQPHLTPKCFQCGSHLHTSPSLPLTSVSPLKWYLGCDQGCNKPRMEGISWKGEERRKKVWGGRWWQLTLQEPPVCSFWGGKWLNRWKTWDKITIKTQDFFLISCARCHSARCIVYLQFTIKAFWFIESVLSTSCVLVSTPLHSCCKAQQWQYAWNYHSMANSPTGCTTIVWLVKLILSKNNL